MVHYGIKGPSPSAKDYWFSQKDGAVCIFTDSSEKYGVILSPTAKGLVSVIITHTGWVFMKKLQHHPKHYKKDYGLWKSN